MAAVTGTVSSKTGTVTTTVTSLLARTYETYADATAIIAQDGRRSTYAELGSSARRLAGGLRELGLATGDRAMIMTKNRPESFVVDHALFAGGFIRVAVSYRLHPREIAKIAADCTPSAIFVDEERVSDVTDAFGEAGLDVAVVALDSGSDVATVDYASLLEAEEYLSANVEPEDIAWLPYTSGTTGEPKGVMLSHRSLIACIRNIMVEVPPIETTDVVLHVAPLTHLSGYLGLAYSVRGAAHVTEPQFEPAATVAAIRKHRVTVVPLVPTMINMLLPVVEVEDAGVDSVHTIVYGGSAIAPDRLVRAVKAFGNVFIQVYGLTETPLPLASLSKSAHEFDPAQPPPERLASAGCVTPFVELRLVKPDGADAEPGELGEIWVRTDTTMSGYWNRPAETSEMINEDGWAATGDVGELKDGYVHIVDRKKDMIVSGGFNIYPSEIENVISQLEAVREVAVIGVPHEKWGESVMAVVVVRDGLTVTEDEIVAICRDQIASYKRPQSVTFLDDLPKTGSGKVMRRELRDTFWAGRARRIGE